MRAGVALVLAAVLLSLADAIYCGEDNCYSRRVHLQC